MQTTGNPVGRNSVSPDIQRSNEPSASRPLAVLIFLSLALFSGAPAAEPWRLGSEPSVPAWLKLSGTERMRVEVMDNTFRIVDPGSDHMVTSKLLFAAEASGEHWFIGGELHDARAWWHDARTPVGTDDVNAAEPLQAYVGYRTAGVLHAKDKLEMQAGRMTLEMGNGRIVGRNGYRNTINGFDGLRVKWSDPDYFRLQAFFTMPVNRLPNALDRDRLLDNDFELDEESLDWVFWGLELADIPVSREWSAELYVVGVTEKDQPKRPSNNQDIVSVGGRLVDKTGPWLFDLEAAWQWGEARATILPGDTNDLDHSAGFVHLETRYQLRGSWSPELITMYDYSTGDSDPTDGKSQRNDPLFGTRRQDFSHLGLYGPFFRANLNSALLGVSLKPVPRVAISAHYRAAWLAQDKDIFLAGVLQDPSGDSGSFLGNNYDFRVDWTVLPRQLTVSFGAACLDKGDFLKNAPRAPDNGDTVYGFSQFVFTY